MCAHNCLKYSNQAALHLIYRRPHTFTCYVEDHIHLHASVLIFWQVTLETVISLADCLDIRQSPQMLSIESNYLHVNLDRMHEKQKNCKSLFDL